MHLVVVLPAAAYTLFAMLCLSMPFGVILQDVRWSLQCFHYQCYAVSFAAVLCCAVLCCAVLCHLCHAAPFHAMLRHPLMLSYFMPCYVVLCHAVAFHATLCHPLPCCSIFKHPVTFFAMVWQAMPCSVSLRNAVTFLSSCTMLCHALLRSGPPLLCYHSSSSLLCHLRPCYACAVILLWVSSHFLQCCIHTCCWPSPSCTAIHIYILSPSTRQAVT